MAVRRIYGVLLEMVDFQCKGSPNECVELVFLLRKIVVWWLAGRIGVHERAMHAPALAILSCTQTNPLTLLALPWLFLPFRTRFDNLATPCLFAFTPKSSLVGSHGIQPTLSV